MPDRLTPVRGSSIFIWELSGCEHGDVHAVAKRCQDAGIRAVLLKLADGSVPFEQYNPQTISVFKGAGLSVVGWAYVYGHDPAAEARTALAQLAHGGDGFVIDAEIEYEQAGLAVGGSWAHTYCGIIRAQYPQLALGLTTFALPTYHPAFPYQAFRDAGCDFWMPQVYWGSWGRAPQQAVEDTVASIVQDGRCRGWPLLPVGQAYLDDVAGTTPVDDRAMHAWSMAVAHRWSSIGQCWWELSHAYAIPGAFTEIADFPRHHYPH